MACETPVVCWKGRASEDIGDSNCGFLVQEVSASGLADAITRILLDPSMAAEMGRAGPRRALQRFTLDIVANNILNLAKDDADPLGVCSSLKSVVLFSTQLCKITSHGVRLLGIRVDIRKRVGSLC